MISEERLQAAAQAVSRAMIDGLPEPEDCQHDFSPEFERAMEKLIRKSKHQGVRQGLKRVACLLLVFLLSSGTFLSVNAEARGKLAGWFSQQVDDASHYFFVEEEDRLAEESPEVAYILPAVPEGYRLVENETAGTNTYWLYANDEGLFFEFGYLTKKTKYTTSDIFFITDGMEQKTVRVHEKSADYYFDETGETGNLIVWMDEPQEVLLYISAYLGETDLLQLAESVTQEEK